MHMKGIPATMQQKATYENVTREVLDYFIKKTEQCKVAGINDVCLERAKSSQSVWFLWEEDSLDCWSGGLVGAHLRRNCRLSRWLAWRIASGFSPIASAIGFSTLLTRPGVKASGSFSQSSSAGSASGVGIDCGSSRYALSAAFTSNSSESPMLAGALRRFAWVSCRGVVFVSVARRPALDGRFVDVLPKRADSCFDAGQARFAC